MSDFSKWALEYEKTPNDFYTAFRYLDSHPAFVRVEQYPHGTHDDYAFMQQLYMMVVRVNPATERIEDDVALNTATRVWLEAGAWISDEEMRVEDKHWTGTGNGTFSHDLNLDCGAPTFEAAIIELAALVKKHYGDKRPTR